MSDFDRQIERELNRILGPVDSASIPVRSAPASGGFMKRILGGTGAAVAAKLATGFAVAALAAAGAGAATEAAITGSLNPMDWGKQVTQTVEKCKTDLRASGVRGIGPCVSAFAKGHGDQVSDKHQSATGARESSGKGHGNKGGDGGGAGHGQQGDKTHGKPTTVPQNG